MRAFFLLLIGGLSVSCAPSSFTPKSGSADELPLQAPIALTVTDGGEEPWVFDIKRQGGGELYAFSRSKNDYRSASWQAVSGAEFSRQHGFDTITLNADQARLSFMPHAKPLEANYTPYIKFSDGGLAVFTGQFDLFDLKDNSALAALGGDVFNHESEFFTAPLTLKSSRPILYGGENYNGEVTLSLGGQASYAYIGETKITRGADFSGVIDPGLPSWLTGRLDNELTMVFEALSERWGFGLTEKATILLAFEGYDLDGISATGGALPGNMIVMQLSGTALREENPRILSHLQWFFTHEAVHIFQSQTGKQYAHNRYSWINEGGANTMASMILASKGLAAEGYLLKTYSDSFGFCTEALEGRTLTEAIERGQEGNYHCGDIIGRITDAALPKYDFFEFWNAFLEQPSEKFTDADYFASMRGLGADEEIVLRLEALTSRRVTNAAAELQSLMDDVGIKTKFVEGKMTEIAFPD